MTVGGLCAECRNWFPRAVVRGRFRVENGVLSPVPEAVAGQYIRLVGSAANDGVWRYPAAGVSDEEFEGAVWLMAVPPEFEELSREIDEWEERRRASLEAASEASLSPFVSESFAGYEYRRREGIGDGPFDWRDPRLGFAARLNRWRKL